MQWRISYLYLSGNTLETKTAGGTVIKGDIREILEWCKCCLPLDDLIELKIIEVTEQFREEDIQSIKEGKGKV
jgi:hypothetical protein